MFGASGELVVPMTRIDTPPIGAQPVLGDNRGPRSRSPIRLHGKNYELTRPNYSPEATACLLHEMGIGLGSTVLDLAAGSGKLTQALVAAGARVVAVEPLPRMYMQIPATVPEAQVVAATAERLPLATASVDAVTVAQAFQWFERELALPEIHRVLRPGGHLGLIGYRFDRSVPWVAELSMAVNRYKSNPRRRLSSHAGRAWLFAARHIPGCVPRLPNRTKSPYPKLVGRSPLFRPVGQRSFKQGHEMDVEMLLKRVGVKKARLTERDQLKAEAAVRRIVADFPPRFELPYDVRFFWYRRCDTVSR